MKEIDAVIRVVNRQLIKIYNSNQPLKQRLGDMGEVFVKYAIKQCLFDQGFRVGKRGSKTFTIYTHYKAKKKKRKKKDKRGVDFYLKFRDDTGKTYRCFIEVKNWKHYTKGIPPYMFNESILNRFVWYDIWVRRFWIVTMNKRNTKYIKDRCKRYTIGIIPITQHITHIFLKPASLKPIMQDFMLNFTDFLEGIVTGRIKKGRLLDVYRERWKDWRKR